MKKLIKALIPIILLLVSVLVMISGGYLKKPRGEYDNVPRLFEMLKSDIMNNKWDNTLQDTEAAETAFKKVRKRIQFSVERDEVNRLENCLVRIKGYATAKDKSGALVNLAEAMNLWDELGK